LFVIFCLFENLFSLGSYNDEVVNLHTIRISGLLRFARNDKLSICHSSPSTPVILNEVKNRIVTKCKPTAEILHFVQNDKMGKVYFSFVIFCCLFQSLGSTNDVT